MYMLCADNIKAIKKEKRNMFKNGMPNHNPEI